MATAETTTAATTNDNGNDKLALKFTERTTLPGTVEKAARMASRLAPPLVRFTFPWNMNDDVSGTSLYFTLVWCVRSNSAIFCWYVSGSGAPPGSAAAAKAVSSRR